VFDGTERGQTDPHWRDCLLFFKYFHSGSGGFRSAFLEHFVLLPHVSNVAFSTRNPAGDMIQDIAKPPRGSTGPAARVIKSSR
jgi:hypothetical protein